MYKAEINTILEHLDYAYQPIRDMKSGTVVGYEAFIRGSDTYKNLTPNEIFDEAYKMNYLYALDIKLREKAIDTIKDKLISTDLKLFYNYDARTLEWDCFTKDLTENILKKYGIHNNNFCYDLNNNQKSMVSSLFYFLIGNRNKGLNVSISNSMIDIFDEKIKLNIKPDYIRINKNIVCMAKNNTEYRKNLESIITFASSKNLKTIAVLIENDNEYKMCS